MHIGAYAEYAKTTVNEVIVLPDRVDYFRGLVYFANLRVAWIVYHAFGKVQPDDTILIHAASGGVGSCITQIAKRRYNNTVIALAETEEKGEFCRSNGADYVVNNAKTDYVKEVLRLTKNQGVDVSLNSIAVRRLQRMLMPSNPWAAG